MYMYLCLVVVNSLPWLHIFKGNVFLLGGGRKPRDCIVHVMGIALNE